MYLATLKLDEAKQPFGQILYRHPYSLLCNANAPPHRIQKHDAFPMCESEFLQVVP